MRRSAVEVQVCVPGAGGVKTEACEVLTMPMNLTNFAQVNIQTQMTIQEAIQARHSVRQYIDKPITEDVVATLKAKIDEVNAKSGLHIQLILNEPKSFQCAMAKYGRFSGVNSYLVPVIQKGFFWKERNTSLPYGSCARGT